MAMGWKGIGGSIPETKLFGCESEGQDLHSTGNLHGCGSGRCALAAARRCTGEEVAARRGEAGEDEQRHREWSTGQAAASSVGGEHGASECTTSLSLFFFFFGFKIYRQTEFCLLLDPSLLSV